MLTKLSGSLFFRIPFLAFAVCATVATSDSSWRIDATPTPIDEEITLAGGSSVNRTIDYAASQGVIFDSSLTGTPPGVTPIAYTYQTGRPAPGDGGVDSVGPPDAGPLRPLGCDGRFEFEIGRRDGPDTIRTSLGNCGSEGLMTLWVTNESASEVQIHLKVSVSIAGGGDETPKGAFVRASVVP
jgi:hypothetical protein